MADHPTTVLGVVDVSAGLIVKASRHPLRQARGWLLPLFLAEVGLLLVFALGPLPTAFGAPATSGIAPAIAYVLLFAGAVGHVLVDSVKQSRAGSSEFKAIDDIALWVHTKEMALTFGVVWLWIGFAGLAVALKSFDPATALIAGYSVDSVADVFLKRFETRVSTFKSDLEKKAPADGHGA
jgi:hypothetical protein